MVQKCIFDRRSLAQMVCGFRLWQEMFREEEQIVLPHVLWAAASPCLCQSVCLGQRVQDGSMLRKFISEEDQIRHPEGDIRV